MKDKEGLMRIKSAFSGSSPYPVHNCLISVFKSASEHSQNRYLNLVNVLLFRISVRFKKTGRTLIGPPGRTNFNQATNYRRRQPDKRGESRSKLSPSTYQGNFMGRGKIQPSNRLVKMNPAPRIATMLGD